MNSSQTSTRGILHKITLLGCSLLGWLGFADATRTLKQETVYVTATAYSSDENQTDSRPFETASGTRVRPGIVALSRDLLRLYPHGSKVRVEHVMPDSRRCGRIAQRTKHKTFTVQDTMNARWTRKIDFWVQSAQEAREFGVCRIQVTLIRVQ